jgi:hypothetical protein
MLVAGCELVTDEPAKPIFNPASHIVINEVFTLPFNNFNTVHSWIELYNPARDSVDLSGWTLSYTTSRTSVLQLLDKDTVHVRDTTQADTVGVAVRYSDSLFIIQFLDSIGTLDVPLAAQRRVILRGDQFLTITTDLNRLKLFTDVGPGSGPEPISTPQLVSEADTNLGVGGLPLGVLPSPDTANYARLSIDDTIRYDVYLFYFLTTDQIVLKDPSGNTVDVVRYGNYSYPGPGPDPFPNNRSVGAIPEYESIARFAGAYFTGNTADDFYITRVQIPQTRPIPQYYSQAAKH